ncbi:MAG: peptidylprolyl isomerase [Clostridia bacterium]|nr:peptidylprolyl isomerase [Clostridia bacterium]
MKRILSLTLAALLIAAVAAGCSGDDNVTGLHHAVITIRDYGEVKLELDADQAPITVAHFMKLAKSGYYDGLTFTRMDNSSLEILQGGNGYGKAGGEEKIKGEFLANGVNNTISHKRGVISMARQTGFDTGATQFFIVLTDSAANTRSLDGLYAGFGRVTEGMEVIDTLCADLTLCQRDSMGFLGVDDQPIIESIRILD